MNGVIPQEQCEPPIASLLIVAYNSRDFIEACLESVPQACGAYAYEILLIDNGTDQTAALVKERFSDVQIIPSRGNVGFGEGNNILARHTHRDARFRILINPDTQLEPGSVSALIEAADNERDYAALGGQIGTPDGSPRASAVMVLPSVYRMAMGVVGLASWANARPNAISENQPIVPVEAISGGFMLVRRGIWDALEGFDESFFLYGEDIDLCQRIRNAGGRLGMVPAARVYHDVGSGAFYSPVRTRYKITASAHFARRHFGPVKRSIYIALLWLRCLLRFGLGSAFSTLSPRFATLAKAFREPALNPKGWMRGFDSEGADPRRSRG